MFGVVVLAVDIVGNNSALKIMRDDTNDSRFKD